MNDRAARRPLGPIVNPAATTTEQFAENFRRIYFGGLADNRSLGGGQGIYHVRVMSPLEVTDEGIGLNMHDARMYTMLADMINHFGGKVLVTSNDTTADYLQGKLIGDDGTGDNLKVQLQELNDGGNEELQIVVCQSDVRDAACGPGSLEVIDRWVRVTQNGNLVLSTEDWRGRLVEYWVSAYSGTIAASQTNNWSCYFYGQYLHAAPGATAYNAIGISAGAPFGVFTLRVEGTSGELHLVSSDFFGEYQVHLRVKAGARRTTNTDTI